MDYAAAVNAEIRDLFAAGADVVQIDEPYMQARPEEARAYGLKALNRRSRASPARPPCTSASATRPSFMRGPSAYSFLPELAGCSCRQVSIETAQSKLDCRVLAPLQGQEDPARRAGSRRPERRDAGDRGRAHSPRAAVRRRREHHRRARLRHEIPAAGSRNRKAQSHGRRRRDRARQNYRRAA